MALAYSFHVGSDKNRKLSSKGLTTKSGTTSLSNNGIQTKAQLTRCDNHNYRLYDNNQEQIEIIKGTDSIVKDVKELYHNEFDELVLEYNNKQRRSDRKIDNYFEHVSQDKTRDLAVEIIIELGDKEFWDTKDEKYKRKMTSVYKQQISDLELLLPEFKVCSAVVHYDETSPHMHIVGVPIKDGYKNGLSSQVCKSKVFDKKALFELQDKMRTLCIDEYNEEYNLSEKLKSKQKGRNRDINVRDMDQYAEAKIAMDLESDKFDKINEESNELDNKSKDISNMIKDIKQNPITKNYSLSQKEKERIETYIAEVNQQNQKYKEINLLKNIINNGYDNLRELENAKDKNKALNIKVKALEKTVKDKDKKISELEKLVDHFKEVASAAQTLFYSFKNKFTKMINHIAKRLTNPQDKYMYQYVKKDFFEHGIINMDDAKQIDNAVKKINKEMEEAAEEFYTKPKKKDDDGLSM